MNRLVHTPLTGRMVLVVPTGGQNDPLPVQAVNRAGASCVHLDVPSALSLLAAEPFAVTAIILSGKGSDISTLEALQAIKRRAPRVPIVFIDEDLGSQSELTVRRVGVHFYAHDPADPEEISAVLRLLTGLEAGTKPARPAECVSS